MVTTSSPRARRNLVVALAVVGTLAVVAGALLAVRPSGGLLGLSAGEHASYLAAGIGLIVVGLLQGGAATMAWRGRTRAAVVAALGLAAWVVVVVLARGERTYLPAVAALAVAVELLVIAAQVPAARPPSPARRRTRRPGRRR
ncbi:MAG: hypothetical protein R2939_22460 [Kofleriaceae bacterium]